MAAAAVNMLPTGTSCMSHTEDVVVIDELLKTSERVAIWFYPKASTGG